MPKKSDELPPIIQPRTGLRGLIEDFLSSFLTTLGSALGDMLAQWLRKRLLGDEETPEGEHIAVGRMHR